MKITKVEAIPVRQKGEIKEINDSAQDGISVMFGGIFNLATEGLGRLFCAIAH